MATAARPTTAPSTNDILSRRMRENAARRAIMDAADELRTRLDVGLTLAGRRFVPLRAVTFDLQNRRAELVQRAGVLPMCAAFAMRVGSELTTDDAELLAAEVLQTAFASGALYGLLAHLLVDADREYLPWSVEAAAERAQFFASLVDPADHAMLAENVLWLVLDFFLRTSAASGIFLRSMAREAADRVAATAINRPPNSRDTAIGSPSAATMTSDVGTPSSAPSLGSDTSTPSPCSAP